MAGCHVSFQGGAAMDCHKIIEILTLIYLQYLLMGARLSANFTELLNVVFNMVFCDVVTQFILLYYLDTFGTLHKLPVGMMQLHVPAPGLCRSYLSHIGTTTVKTKGFLNCVLFHMLCVNPEFATRHYCECLPTVSAHTLREVPNNNVTQETESAGALEYRLEQ